MSSQTVIATFWFNSDSSNAIYETLVYSDCSTSCNCRGWTFRRVDANGHRSCKHTRIVAAGHGEKRAQQFLVKPEYDSMMLRQTKPTTSGVMPAPGQRKMIIG